MKKIVALLMALSLLSFSFAVAETAPAAVPALTITFVENPTTGYTWTVKSSDEAVLAVEDLGYVAAPNPDNADGKGGTHSWTLTGKAEGDATATFVFGQAWDGGETADTIVYAVHVDADLNLTVTDITGIPDLYDPLKGTVILTENPTTGYSWAYTASAEGILTPERDEFVAPASASDGSGKVGEGGYHVWVFKGAAEGDVTLTYAYAQSWEEGVTPDATVTYTFHVDKDLNVTLTEVGGDYAEYDPLLGDLGE